jgi:hypothetical protein
MRKSTRLQHASQQVSISTGFFTLPHFFMILPKGAAVITQCWVLKKSGNLRVRII